MTAFLAILDWNCASLGYTTLGNLDVMPCLGYKSVLIYPGKTIVMIMPIKLEI